MFCFELVSHSFYYIIIAVCTLCSLPAVFTTKGLEQNQTKNHIVCNQTVSKSETVSYSTTKLQQSEENNCSLIVEKHKVVFYSYFSEYKNKIFDSKLFSRPPSCYRLKIHKIISSLWLKPVMTI